MPVSVCARQSPSRFAAMPRSERLRFSVFDSVRIAGRVLVSAPARGSARGTGRLTPPRQRSRRLASKTRTRLALPPVYLPYINRIFGVNGYFGAKPCGLQLFEGVFRERRLRLGNPGITPVCLPDDEVYRKRCGKAGGAGCRVFLNER